MGAAPAEVATQLARSAEPGDREAISALRQAAQSVGHSDASVAADLSKRALELLAADDADHGPLVAETVELLNRASRYQEAEELALAAISEMASPQEEAEIRLRLPSAYDTPQRRVEENRRALQLANISDVTRARHVAWLAVNEVCNGMHDAELPAVIEAAAAASAGDLESRILCEITLAILEYSDGYPDRAIQRMERLDALTRGGNITFAHTLAAVHRTVVLTFVGRSEEAAALVAEGTEKAQRERNAMALPIWATMGAMVHLAAGRLSSARATVEALPRRELGGATEVKMNRTLILAEVAVHFDDRKLLRDMMVEARDEYPAGSPMVSRGAAAVLALGAWHQGDLHESMRWLSADTTLLVTPLWPNIFEQLILTARVAAAAGDAGLRSRVLQSIEVLERERPTVSLLGAVAQHIRGILERDADALVRAANALRRWRPLLSAGAAEDAGGELAHTQRNVDAIDQFNAAFDTYMEHEAVADARRVGRQLRRLGVERRIVSQPRVKTGWDSLTDSELKVVNLIAQGVTNRSVATQLHLSIHTVKNHVHNAFAKLGINSRAQLAQLMRGD
jgi:DNA-binding CsgD family transcriptional regulator